MIDARLHLPTAAHELVPSAPGWPRGLSDLSDPPARLRVVGALDQGRPHVAVVGTRHADAAALHFAEAIGHGLAAAGAVVVSGGARGVDAAAHAGALDAGGPTVAVLASGLARAYPPEHAGLFSRVAASGALVTEVDDDAAPLPARFIERNRLIAALSRVVVVVQAPARSGALSTAAVARRLGRSVMAVPDAPGRPRAAGTLALLRGGALLCCEVADVLQELFGRPHLVSSHAPGGVQKTWDFKPLDGPPREVVRYLKQGPARADQIARQLDIPIDRVQEVLLTLELDGRVQQRPDGFYTCKK